MRVRNSAGDTENSLRQHHDDGNITTIATRQIQIAARPQTALGAREQKSQVHLVDVKTLDVAVAGEAGRAAACEQRQTKVSRRLDHTLDRNSRFTTPKRIRTANERADGVGAAGMGVAAAVVDRALVDVCNTRIHEQTNATKSEARHAWRSARHTFMRAK